MTLRRSTIYLGTTAGLALALIGTFLHAAGEVRSACSVIDRKRELVKKLELTDLCLFTDAIYTRHLSMTDLATPFQDAPVSLEHFPSGSLVMPPAHLTRNPDSHD